MISSKQIDQVVKLIVGNYHPNKIILFGSYASGNANKDSDVDLLIIKNSDVPRYKRSREIHKLFNPYPFAMDILVYTNDEINRWKDIKTSFIYEAFKNGIVLYYKSFFRRNTLS